MSHTSYGTITITDITDISDVYLEYALAISSATVTNNYTFSQNGEIGWNTTVPIWASGYQIWVRQVTEREGINSLEYGTPYLHEAINQANIEANNAYTIATGINQHFWSIASPYADGIPAGSYITYNAIDDFKTNKTGGNLLTRSDGVYLRDGTKTLSSLTGTALTFYNPSTSNPSAILNSTGLNITEGSITLGIRTKDYQLTSDTSVNLSKTYYTRSGEGTTQSPYVYTQVNNPSTANINTYYELVRDTHAFQVDSNGYLNAQAGWIGGVESYVKLEKEVETGDHYLDVRLSQLDLLLNSDLYGQENVVDILDLISQQIDFNKIWGGDVYWEYFPDDMYVEVIIDDDTIMPIDMEYYEYDEIEDKYFPTEDIEVEETKVYYIKSDPYKVYEYTDKDTQEVTYYYDEHEFNVGQYESTSDIAIDVGKYYYTRSGAGTSVNPYVYTQVSNPVLENIGTYYEFVDVEPSWVKYEQDIDLLTSKKIAGLNQSLQYTEDSLGNQQKLLISSSQNEEADNAVIEVDSQLLSLAVQGDGSSALKLSMKYDEEVDAGEFNINLGDESLIVMNDNNDYSLEFNTNIKFESLGLFHYKNGLAIGIL